MESIENHQIYDGFLHNFRSWGELKLFSLPSHYEVGSQMNNSIEVPLENGWLSCQLKEGWGPISQRFGDLTPCFLHGFIFGLCALYMIVLGSYQVFVLRSRKLKVSNRITWTFYVKLALVALNIILMSGSAIALGKRGIIRSALVLNVLANIIAFGLHYIEQFKAEIQNGVLLTYWLFQFGLSLARLASLSLRDEAKGNFFAFSILIATNTFFVLVLETAFPFIPVSSFKGIEKVSPFDRANIFSRGTFEWMSGIMKKGYVQYLTQGDLPPLPKGFRSSVTSDAFSKYWNEQTGKPSLAWALMKAFGLSFFVGGIFKATQDVLAFIQPQLLKRLIEFVNEYNNASQNGQSIPLTKGLMISGTMFLVSVSQTFFFNQYFRRVSDLGMRIKTSLTSSVYKKSMILSSEAKQESSTGDIVNLMSVDVQRMSDLVQNVQIIWSGPLQIIICLVSLHRLLGRAMWAGVFIMIFMIPLNASIARYQRNLQKTQMKYKDERSRLINEILNNVKSLKLYGWEEPYLQKLGHVRNEKELRNLKRMGIFSAVGGFAWNSAPFLVSCSTFGVFVLIEKGRTLSTDIVFPALSLFNLLSFPLAVFPMVITNIVEAQVSIARLVNFLTSAEIQQDAVTRLPRATKTGDVAVSVKDGTFLWSKSKTHDAYKVALSKINFEAKKGTLNCVVGKIGSGKSALIQAILGDLYRLEGEVTLRGKVAYVSQIPWIMNGTIRENILFGHKYDAEFYQHTIKACALNVDLKILPKGDKTQVGEKGITLSGGQKARLSLARAVYSRADVYLFDDPLSAVDAHVGKHLIDHVLGPDGLLKSKCKILTTNSIGVLSIADGLHLVQDGKLVEQGTYDQVIGNESSPLRQLIKEFGNEREEKEAEKVEETIDGDDLSSSDFEAESLRRASDVSLNSLSLEEEEEEDDDIKARKESHQKGKVKWQVYWEYAKACNSYHVLLYLAAIVSSTLTSVLANVWLKHWSEVNTERGENPHSGRYLSIYFALGIASSFLILSQTCILWMFCTIHGSKKLHAAMANCVLRAPMSFFETTPIGRILNRFSNDVYKVDEILGRVFGMFFNSFFSVLFSVIVICFSTWQTILFIIPLCGLYYYYQQYYMRTSRELRRLDSISRSPIFAHFQESLNGVSIIRAYGQEGRFKYLNESIIDRNMSAYHPSINANRWLSVRLEFIGSLIILSASGFAILTLKTGGMTAGLVGLSVSYAFRVTQSLNWIVRMTVEVETNIVAVERIMEYSSLKSEAPQVIESNRPKSSWPSEGNILFRDYSAKYRPELDLVLKDINLTISPREKVGIVGRTGAGKSSLTLALFRIIEAVDGDIAIDDVVTKDIGLSDLRRHLSIIPQDSQVFEGTIRSNLDPTDSFTDEQIWKALELAHLKKHVLAMSDDGESEDAASGLNVRVTEGGANLSVGQRQLMCLARALLIPSKILVLDEATAAIDVETDKVLQETIRTEFKDRTILTIAHRLNTIMDSDRIIVLDAGRIVEQDTPERLLKDKNSFFYSLCEQQGFIKDDSQ
ncbi:Piso0_003604 [Millerozyma farinosa CBS 7064]|uniref:Piso0_003604 protein n=1 Tax=Pichia sorbitophila (strain ATCC MYA-4447 / BCRC 22081 / CBS 7064 / NBRC 10061 / NRRL Y-12695) TaxID=559304 RepID=G8YJJ2_PICSO|nr:Piso0_003604 [Millerozyma farinosa CBS 7064]CCE81252.1 Piso0_003604 [Millerozyma farinosa CBS 7064]